MPAPINFPPAPPARLTSASRQWVMEETVRVLPSTGEPTPHRLIETGRSHLLVHGHWEWQQMLDYLSSEMTARFGASPIPRAQGAGVCKRFIKRWGPEASEQICRYAIDHLDGRWLNQPITIGRFSTKSDPFFAEPIATRLDIAIPAT